jgi:phospholipid/cholesterol/gamma-HCH transport system substrate-binding protein
VSRTLSRTQAILLGLVTLLILGAGVWGLYQIGKKQGMFNETFEVSVLAEDAQEVEPGTLVRIRGMEAGRVVSVDFADQGSEHHQVRFRLQLDQRFQDRLFADATAQIHTKGLLGTSVVSINPGKPSSGPLSAGEILASKVPELADVTVKLYKVAERTEELLKDVQESQGTLVKLLRDDDLYQDFRQTASDAKILLRNANDSIVAVKTEMASMKDFVRVGKDAITSLKQDADAIKGMPIIRNYVEDAASILVKPSFTSDRVVCKETRLFEEGRAVLTESGKQFLDEVANWLNSNKVKNSEVVVVSFTDPKNADFTHASAKKLTEKQSEVVVQFLRDRGVHKLSFWSRRTITPLGMGKETSPIVEKEEIPSANVQIVLYIPQS